MADLLLHWTHKGITYSVRHVRRGNGLLFAAGPGQAVRRSRGVISTELIQAWRGLDDSQRAAQADALLRDGAQHPPPGPARTDQPRP